MSLLLGIDLGTSYFKIGLFDLNGRLRGLGRVAVPKREPHPGWCEVETELFWTTLREGLRAALADAGAKAQEIVGISYSSQASTFVLLDDADRPLTPLIVWTDARGDVPGEWNAFSRSAEFARHIGFEGLSAQSAPVKWRWFQRRAPELWHQVRRVMTVSDYLTFALTGERAGDASTAAFLASFDLETKTWWPAALDLYGISAQLLSAPHLPGARVGKTLRAAETLLGIREGIPFAVGALDHHAAAIGSGLGSLAEASISTGTVLAALVVVDRAVPTAGCFHGLHTKIGQLWRLAFDPQGAGQLEEFKKRFAPELSIEDLLAEAARANVGECWIRGEQKPNAPVTRNSSAGNRVSEGSKTLASRGAQVRFILERVAAKHRELLHLVSADASGGPAVIRSVVATGGGARSPLWLQITADVLNLPVATPSCIERACLGAACFAGVAANAYSNLTEATSAMIRPDRLYEPQSEAVRRYSALLGNVNP